MTETLTLPVFIKDTTQVDADPELHAVYLREVKRTFAKGLAPFIAFEDKATEHGTIRTYSVKVGRAK